MVEPRSSVDQRGNVIIEDPPIARFLFSNTRMAWLWTLLRLWLGFAWPEASLHKIVDPTWVNTGDAVKGFWERALAVAPNGQPVVAFKWYRGFLQALYDAQAWTWLAPLIAWGEVLIGAALILGLFTGIAAFGGGTLNWTFLMAGTASTNGLMFPVAGLLILAWKTAGWYGLDRWALPLVGTPWTAGRLRLVRVAAPPPVRS